MAAGKLDLKVVKQLALGLEVEVPGEEEGSTPSTPTAPHGGSEASWVSPEEQAVRSEGARLGLEMRFKRGIGDEAIGDEGEIKQWVNEYTLLTQAGWPWRVAAYIAWCTVPRKFRWPRTQEELATQVLGLTTDRVIATWRRRNPAIDQVVAMFQAAPLEAHRLDFFRALIVSASNPDYKNHNDRRMALEMTGDYTPKVKAEVSRVKDSRDLSGMTEEELDALAEEALRMKGEQHMEDDADED
jgi:hypothetical protein